ncbi:MAG: ABC transporter ATP-binding protein [Tissierellia bacterium]|nr:ABC transporter ATP-binding protein [Tissierellia bacterium]
MLEIRNLKVNYGGIKALQGIDIDVPDNSIVALIGANGAGKSTTLKAIMGMVKKADGSVKYNGEELKDTKTMDVIKKRISLSPEGRRIFPNLTVYENLIIGSYTVKDKSLVEKNIERSYDLFPILKERSWQKAGTLSGGEQQMLAVARAMMVDPEILMLDEPSLGLAPLIVNDIFDIIKKIHSLGNSILLVEQNAKKALEVADYAYVLETGSIVLQGEGKELLNDDRVKGAYLGE